MHTFEQEIKLDQFGNVDTKHYIAQAKAQRSEFLVGMFRSLVRNFKKLNLKRQQNIFNSTRSFGTV